MEELFHISNYDYSIGYIVPLPDLTHYAQLAIDQSRGWVDEYLDSRKPDAAPLRRQKFFAFDRPQSCIAFKKDGKFLYKVNMVYPLKAPFCLVDFIYQNGENNPINIPAAEEYWLPKQNWKLYEYLSAEMTIIERVDITQDLKWNNILNDLTDDKQLASKIF